MRDEVLQVFEYAHGQRAIDRREVVQKLSQGAVVLQVVQQCSDGYARSDEHWRAAQELRVGMNARNGFVHVCPRSQLLRV